jgi:hypothetical protein
MAPDSSAMRATFRDVVDAYAATQPRAPFLIAPEPGLTVA